MAVVQRRLLKLIKDALATYYKESSIRPILEDAGFVPSEADTVTLTPLGMPDKRSVVGMYLDKVDWSDAKNQFMLADVLQELLIDYLMVDYLENTQDPENRPLIVNLAIIANDCGYVNHGGKIRLLESDSAMIQETSNVAHFDIPSLREDFRRIRENIVSDVCQSITSAHSLLEGVCKYVLEKGNIEYGASDNVVELVKKVIELYGLGGGVMGEQTKHFLRSTAHNIYEARRIYGTAHGRGADNPIIEIPSSKGEFVVDLCFLVSKFLIQISD